VILADSSVWIDHFRRGNPELRRHLEAGEIACHPFVIGELACGRLSPRRDILALLERLPKLPIADHDEALGVVDGWRLEGRGLGWIDVHLLASTVLGGAQLWTLDIRLRAAAAAVGAG
jgi:predicted nucleic acid-binding protein